MTKITKMHETTFKLFLKHEKSILEKEKEEDRQRRKEDREHKIRIFSMLRSRLGGHGSYPLHQFASPGPPPPSQQQQHSEEFDSGETYTGLQYQLPPSQLFLMYTLYNYVLLYIPSVVYNQDHNMNHPTAGHTLVVKCIMYM